MTTHSHSFSVENKTAQLLTIGFRRPQKTDKDGKPIGNVRQAERVEFPPMKSRHNVDAEAADAIAKSIRNGVPSHWIESGKIEFSDVKSAPIEEALAALEDDDERPAKATKRKPAKATKRGKAADNDGATEVAIDGSIEGGAQG